MPKKSSTELPRSRPPLERMMRIHQSVQGGGFPNASNLARELEVSTKSIQRDIEFMRDRLGLPLEYDGSRFGYHYTEEVGSFPTLQITEGELFALLVAEKALQQYRGTNFEKPLVSAFKKMAASLPDTVSLSIQDWEQTISFRMSAEPVLNLEIFDLLAKAVARRDQITFQYRKPGKRQPEERRVDPYHLANINGEWFLFAYDHAREDVRTFVPVRISRVRTTGQTFEKPRKFSLEKRLRDSFGVHSAEGHFDVTIRFNEYAADFIREKRWHPSQKIREMGGGGLELAMKLSSLGEVQRWVLGWGSNAAVISPAELKQLVRQAAEGILRNA
jgi:proteasome accessory factor B